jgi:predicted alternative tryptophan synthase beta-subunit
VNDTVKYVLDESRIPKHWYNIMADLPPRRDDAPRQHLR